LKHISDVVTETAENPRQWSESSARQAETLLSELWVRLAEIYGHKLVSAYGEIPPDTWAHALADCSAADIGTGLRACLESGEDWPPSLAAFLRMCRPMKRINEAAYVVPAERQLPHKLDDDERAKGRAIIAKLRRGLTA